MKCVKMNRSAKGTVKQEGWEENDSTPVFSSTRRRASLYAYAVRQ